MEIITIDGRDGERLMVAAGRVRRATLQWQAPGLDIYLIGVSARMYATACNVACNEAIARHIPARALRRVAK